MPFCLYDVSGLPGHEKYDFAKQIPLAGKHGPIHEFSTQLNVDKSCPFRWQAREADLIPLVGGTDGQRIVIDLKPRVTGNVSLYRLLDVWGFSYEAWTPIALRLQCLFVDHSAKDAPLFKKSFVDQAIEHELVGEFLYLQGGVTDGNWNWGLVGRVNGALLWKQAFDYLVAGLSQSLVQPPA